MSTERNKFNIFNFFNKEGKGVEKGTELKVLEKPGIANFFKLFGRHVNQFLSINMLYVFGNFPILFALLAISGYTSKASVSPASGLFSALSGTFTSAASSSAVSSPVLASLNGIYGKQAIISFPTTVTYIMIGIACLLLFTFGIVNVGCTYLLRNMIRGENLFIWQDFWYAIKKNLKQGIIFGVIDVVITLLLIYDLIFFRSNLNAASIISPLYFMSFAMILIYFFMRMYIYPMLITFDLSIFKMFKNAILFTVLGIKRNLVCLVGVALVVFLNFGIFLAFPPIGIVLPIVITIAICKYISVYCAYPVIKKYMIDPYYKEVKQSGTETN